MAERKREQKHRRRQGRRQLAAVSQSEDMTSAPDSPLPDNTLFQTDPPFSKPSLYKPKGWTDTVAGYIREAKKLTMCLLRNECLMDHPYQWHVTINFEAVQTPAQIRQRWAKARKSLKRSGVVALSVMEVNRSNHVHFHLIVSSRMSKGALEQAVEKAMPSQNVIGWHNRPQRIKPGETWELAHYVTKAKKPGYVNGRLVDDYYASKRILFKPKLGLHKHYAIGPFWVKPKAAIWTDIRAKEKRIADGLEQPGVRKLVDFIYELLDRTMPLKGIERAFGFHADSEPVKRWVEQLIADDAKGCESNNTPR
jgi:hypothetical protein